MRTIQSLSLVRVLVIFSLGLVCGIQTALYLFDRYDDGIADPTSALIALAMIVLSVGFILFIFRGKRRRSTRETPPEDLDDR